MLAISSMAARSPASLGVTALLPPLLLLAARVPSVSAVVCPDGYKEVFCSCFMFYTSGTKNWTDAGAYCESTGGHLAVLSDCDVFSDVVALIKSQAPVTTQRPTDDPCEAATTECRYLQCSYGVAASVNEHGCTVCSCNDPCEKYQCPEGSRCAVDVVQGEAESGESGDGGEAAQLVAVCREVNKPGDCPSLRRDLYRCDTECDSDASCADDHKCCYNGCSYSCLEPPRDAGPATATERPAYTPQPESRQNLAHIVSSNRLVTAEEQDVAVLLCEAAGTPTPTVTWYKGNQQLDTTKDRHRLLDAGSLQIVGTLYEDTGHYRCVADNGLAAPDQREVELKITEGKPREAKVVPNRNTHPVVTMGQSTIIRCWAVGIPRPAITWWKGTKMHPLLSQKYEQHPNLSIRITAITLRDLGPYTCQAYNGLGRAATNTVTLLAMGPVRVTTDKDKEYLKYIVKPPRQPGGERQPPPSQLPPTTTATTTTEYSGRQPGEYYGPWTPAPETLPDSRASLRALIRTDTPTTAPGNNVTFTCEVVGEPLPQVIWYKDGTVIQASDEFAITKGTALHRLTLVGVKPEQSGLYSCKTYTTHGSASSSTVLSVEGMHKHHYWIGATDAAVEGQWYWVTGQHVAMGVPYWAHSWNKPSEPAGGTAQNCLMLDASYGYYFNDNECKNVRNFICQSDPLE